MVIRGPSYNFSTPEGGKMIIPPIIYGCAYKKSQKNFMECITKFPGADQTWICKYEYSGNDTFLLVKGFGNYSVSVKYTLTAFS